MAYTALMAGMIRDILRKLTGDLGRESPARSPSRPQTSSPPGILPVYPRVLLIVYDPKIPSQGYRRLSKVLGWNDPDRLVKGYVSDLRETSYGYCNYQVVERIDVDGFPMKIDGFTYGPDEYLALWRSRKGFHQPDWADYERILDDFNVAQKIGSDEIDEVWLFAFPYGGFYESRMVGPGAFWCNAPPIEGWAHGPKRFVVMGFNYERGVGEMLESFGHRAESIMAHVFRRHRGESNLWERFTRYDKRFPGQAEVGNIHFAPNSRQDYDWGNRSRVVSRCDTWLNFPDLNGAPRMVSSDEWGNGDTRLHHKWWLRHLPHVAGVTTGVANNWWEYIVNPDSVP